MEAESFHADGRTNRNDTANSPSFAVLRMWLKLPVASLCLYAYCWKIIAYKRVTRFGIIKLGKLESFQHQVS